MQLSPQFKRALEAEVRRLQKQRRTVEQGGKVQLAQLVGQAESGASAAQAALMELEQHLELTGDRELTGFVRKAKVQAEGLSRALQAIDRAVRIMR